MASEHFESELRTASRHVVENVLRVEQLEELIAEVEANGEDTSVFLSALSLIREKLAEWRAAHEQLERSRTAAALAADSPELACELR